MGVQMNSINNKLNELSSQIERCLDPVDKANLLALQKEIKEYTRNLGDTQICYKG